MNRTTDRAHSDPAFYDGVVAMLTERGTSHVSVIDAQELMVSVTTYVKKQKKCKIKNSYNRPKARIVQGGVR